MRQPKVLSPQETAEIKDLACEGMLFHEAENKHKSLKSQVAGTFMVFPAEIIIPDYDSILSKSGVNGVNKARVMIHRPKWETLKATFELHVDNDSITRENVEQVLTIAGNNIGIGSWRPAKGGSYGLFSITKLEEI